MKNYQNMMILNNENIGISKIELNRSELFVVDKSYRYSLCVHIYNWKEINKIEVGKKQKIDFNEYCLAENNESALIWPTDCYVEKISDDSICFYLEFRNLSNSTTYMNKRGCFDIELKSLEVKVFINYKDAIDGSIIYEF